MGIQDRKQRQLAERETQFLDAAWSMIQRDGVLNLQMSRLAAECEYAVGTLYLHFASKEDLLVSLATRSVADRVTLYQRVLQWAAPSRWRLLAFLVADVLIARRAPEFFRLAQYVSTHTVWAACSEPRRAAAMAAAKPLGDAIEQIAADAVAAGEVQSQGLTGKELCGGIWSMAEGTHGLVSAAGLLETHSIPRPYQVLMWQANALLNGLLWQPLIDLADEQALSQIINKIMSEVFPEFPRVDCLEQLITVTKRAEIHPQDRTTP